jgi:hypothetical protein
MFEENLLRNMKYWVKIRDLLVNSPMYYGASETSAVVGLVIEKLNGMCSEYRMLSGNQEFHFNELMEEKKPVLPEPFDWHRPNNTADESSSLLCDAIEAYNVYEIEKAEYEKQKKAEYRQHAVDFFRRMIGNYAFEFGDHDLISCGDVTLKYYPNRGNEEQHFTVIRQCKNCNAPYEVSEKWIRSIHDIGIELNTGPEFCRNCDV